MKRVLVLFFFILLAHHLYSQNKTGFINANSRKVAIKDGNEPITRWWEYLQTKVRPVVYHIAKINQKRRVTFYTDIDSISFDVVPNKNYDFKVLLNGRDTCYAQISTVIPSYFKNGNNCTLLADTIPFTLEQDHFIHIKGRINNSEILDFIFDTGAGACVLTERGKKKVKLLLDGQTDGEGSSGFTIEQTSSSNLLQLEALYWKNLPLIYIDYKGAINTDGVIGYTVFEDKVVEIDYDNNCLIIHNQIPKNISGYTKRIIRHNLNGTFVQATLQNGNKKYTGWYLFDTGGCLTLEVSGDYAASNDLYGTMKRLGSSNTTGNGKVFYQNEIVELPFLELFGFSVPNVPIHIASPDKSFYGEAGILGNIVLKRFNTIIDYPHSTIYLKSNGLMKMGFGERNKIFQSKILLPALCMVLLMLGVVYYRRKKVNPKNNN